MSAWAHQTGDSLTALKIANDDIMEITSRLLSLATIAVMIIAP